MDATDPRLKMLFDYTLFHVGLYTTLISALFALMTLGHAHEDFLKITVACFLIAGAAGGAIASNIPLYSTFADYTTSKLTVFGIGGLNFWVLAHVEHGAFWAGIIVAAIGILRK